MQTMTSTSGPTPNSLNLSIVIITKNEARNVARAIESVLRAVGNKPDTEILLVDSASTDDTIEIARRYPINIVRLHSEWFHSVSAGRFIGMLFTRGDLVLHMDGDMELDPGWVECSVSYMTEHPDVGAVGGFWRNTYLKDNNIVGEEDEYRDPLGRELEVRYVGGAALYRRSAIQEMGGFLPFIKGEEGVYLSLGIRNAGYKVVRLPVLMSRHYTIPPQSLSGKKRRLRLGFLQGHGQLARHYWGTGIFWIYLKERGAFAIYLLGVLVSVITFLITVFSGNVLIFGGWILIAAGVILFYSFKKRSLRKALVSFLTQTWVAYGAVRGFLAPLRSAAEYPTDPEIIQVVTHLGGLDLSRSSSQAVFTK